MSDWAYQIETYKITMHFYETVVQTSLWPMATLLLLIAYRGQISNLISWIIKIKSLKYKDIHLAFQEGIDEIKHELKDVQINVSKKDIQCSEKTEINELTELASISTRAAISAAWNLIEKRANEIIPLLVAKDKLAPGQSGLMVVENVLFTLSDEGYAPESIKRIARNLRRLRNKVVHNVLAEVISEDQVQEYIVLACAVIEVIEEANKKLQKEDEITKS